jgi:ribosomal-protein-alanine N-acetyltransferase
MTIRLSPAGSESSGLLASLHAACFDRPWSWKEFDGFFDRNQIIALIAYDGEEAVGFCFSWVVVDQCELLAIAVRKPWRGQGVGAQLLTESLTQAKAQGAVVAYLEVNVENASARKLYERAGFEASGLRKAYYYLPDGTPQDALSMTCVLGE